MVRRDVVVVGGSAGSRTVLRDVLSALPADLPAAVFVVTHVGRHGSAFLAEHLAESCALKLCVARDGQPIANGHVYFPPADHHMLVFPGVIRLGRGPRENLARPAIDPLFRSAALAFGGRVIGVVLSGYLNDGASGLCAIRSRNGLALVQHPEDAEVPSMPEAALQACSIDETVTGADLPAALMARIGQEAPAGTPPDRELELEVRIALGSHAPFTSTDQLGSPSTLSCPHCHGVLSELRASGPLRYRCQTGHAFTAEAALAAQQVEVDKALMVALRVMQERESLTRRMAEEARSKGRPALAETYEARCEEYAAYVAILRDAAVGATSSPVGEAAE